ncbi:MAG: 5'-nucleotidase [Burkholderiales bacterium]|nr:5'-nucleotidase [Burkholderiales bacterium]
MPAQIDDRLIIAISSRALFDLSESHAVYEAAGVEAYQQHQVEHENELLTPGVAFDLVRKLLKLNDAGRAYVEVVLLSRNSADTGLRIFNAIRHYGLGITRAVFTSGSDTSRYVPALGTHLFLSADPEDVRHALESGHAAATIVPQAGGVARQRAVQSATAGNETPIDELRIAFDGDAVLFSDEAERIYQAQGLDAFSASERAAAATPLGGGPFKNFLAALHRIQTEFPRNHQPIRTALVTARSAPAHERVIRTLRAWGVRIDEALFLGGLDKAEFLRAFGADIFFDDQRRHVESASRVVTAGHVPHGITNQ